MSNPFVAEIRIFPFNFAPKGWALCDGQLLAISTNTALFSLLGVNYGGDGKSTFGLPNLQGSVAIHTTQYSGGGPFGTFDIGQSGGEDSVTVLSSEMASHNHNVIGDANPADSGAVSPSGMYPGNTAAVPLNIYSNSAAPQTVQMNPRMISVTGNNGPHNNLMPYLTLIYCIALQGVYPPRG